MHSKLYFSKVICWSTLRIWVFQISICVLLIDISKIKLEKVFRISFEFSAIAYHYNQLHCSLWCSFFFPMRVYIIYIYILYTSYILTYIIYVSIENIYIIYIYIYNIYIYIFIYIPRIHKRLHDVQGRSVISNCGTPTEKKSRNFLIRNLNP